MRMTLDEIRAHIPDVLGSIPISATKYGGIYDYDKDFHKVIGKV